MPPGFPSRTTVLAPRLDRVLPWAVSEQAAPPSEARTRLLRRASELFYAYGIKGVGVDQVIRESQVTRATFYRHFPSKEALIVAYLEAADRAAREFYAGLAQRHADPADRLRAVADELGESFCLAGFRGCPFINAAAEFPDPDAPVRRAVAEHRTWLEAFFRDAFAEAGHPDPDTGARAMLMLRDGAAVAGYLASADNARHTLVDGVNGLLASTR
jgi:AcrR family transcriptional regulator